VNLAIRHAQAIKDYGEAIKLEPTPLAYNNRAVALLAIGRTDDALADLSQAKAPVVESHPDTSVPSTSYTGSTSGTVQVRGYTRKDGTYVSPHTRSAPRR